MATCNICFVQISEDVQHYQFSDMGPDILSIIENNLCNEPVDSGNLCAPCFENIMQMMSSSTYEEYELPNQCDTNVCVWCRTSLFRRRSHALIEGPERRLIAERISPRIIPDGSLLCYTCWIRCRRSLPQQLIEPASSSVPQSNLTNTNICVWCLCSLNRTRRHTLPDGPERREIMARIHPREIPSNGLVCYACWVSARRNIQKAQATDERCEEYRCVLCLINIFRRRRHSLSNGPERDEVVARIYPRELPEPAFLCSTCWDQTQTNQQDNVPIDDNNATPQVTQTMTLEEFSHTTSSSGHCFVPNCSNPDRLCVPDYLKKRILTSRNVFVTDNARICGEHKSVYNWESLNRQMFSNTFTKNEIESMLRLSILEINLYMDFENIHTIEDNVFVYWTGLTKEKYMNVFNTISPALTCTTPQTALGVYLIKARTEDSHERLASLLCLNKSSITRLLKDAREALLQLFVPLHLGLNHITRNQLINKNLIIPEGLFGNREERVPIIICDGTYINIQKSSNYQYQKKTYSLHKYRNLVKPFLFVATDGHIIDVFGPYPATESDSDIMKALFQNENGELRTYFRENDVFILDRGFRDCILFLESLGLSIYKPETLEQGETQLPTIRANKSRYVTLCRWVVEIVNGRFKRDYKLFRQEYFNLATTHLMDDIRICASLINAFHPKIENRPDAEIILNRALQRKEMPNLLAQLIIDNRINRFRAQFTSINAELPELGTFPEMSMSDLIIFALGTYQIKQARSYYGEHVRRGGLFQVEVSDQLEAVSAATTSQQDPVLIRGRIKSRHQSGRTYYTYILMARQGTNWDDKIISYYCSCIAGQRTVGCCAHTMTIVWYLGWARHQASIAAPASFLDEILIRDSI